MTMPDLTFSPDSATAPTGSASPTARELAAMSAIASGLYRGGRVVLMNQICTALKMPPGGWTTGKTHLFEGNDIRLLGLLAMLAKGRVATLVAGNLRRAAQFTQVNIMMAMVIAAREHSGALTANGASLINSYYEGGLDFLWDEKDRLGLPYSVTGVWEKAPPLINPESNREVHPAMIPAGDQMITYAAQVSTSFRLNFRKILASEFGDDADPVLARASRLSLLVWQAYSFLSPGGPPYNPEASLKEQLGQKFGIRSALGYIAHLARQTKTKPDLNLVYNDTTLNGTAWVRSAKTRTAETLFLECLLKQARIILSP